MLAIEYYSHLFPDVEQSCECFWDSHDRPTN